MRMPPPEMIVGVGAHAAPSQALSHIEQRHAHERGETDTRRRGRSTVGRKQTLEKADADSDRDDADPIEPATADGRFQVAALRFADRCSVICVIRRRRHLNRRMQAKRSRSLSPRVGTRGRRFVHPRMSRGVSSGSLSDQVCIAGSGTWAATGVDRGWGWSLGWSLRRVGSAVFRSSVST